MAKLVVDGLSVVLPTARGPLAAVRDLSFVVEAGAALGIVGESGCGKSMTALAVMGLLPEGAVTRGRVRLDGEELLSLDDAAMSGVRGRRIAMVFQEPMTALNPVHPVGSQIAEALVVHGLMDRNAAAAEAVRLLDRVGIAEPDLRARSYPHQLSGGQRQRAMIAMALSCGPEILIADEPTSALDVTVQRQILDLIRELVRERSMALVLISHDLAVVAGTVDRVLVMYGGTGVEEGDVTTLFRDLAHPYAQGLFRAGPARALTGSRRPARLPTIAGTVPDMTQVPMGCTFAPRCDLAEPACRGEPPPWVAVGADHHALCRRTDAALARWRTS
jgi:peptide/nickel transport system ATP-binding protein